MPFKVVKYSIQKLAELMADVAKTPSISVREKQHLDYFDVYFSVSSAQTIVVESEYIDHDYLEDYSNYYVKCFHDYDRKCARLHIFQTTFSKERFALALGGDSAALKDVQDGYLGFIVVKPLPRTIIGRTCLKTYPSEGKRCYPITRKYTANLFGINLSVDTLAYQEQDTVVAACATSALWSVFHGSGILFHHPIPSPIEITKAALKNSPAEHRNLPNKDGLTLEQLGQAIRDVGLDPFMLRASNEHILKSTAYGYMRAGIPIYFSIRLFAGSNFRGGHGVAIAGYSIDPAATTIPMPGTGFLLKASRIDKLYVHDDQIGPFARMIFDGGVISTTQLTGSQQTLHSLTTSWDSGTTRAYPNAILIPLYHKIRIPYAVVHDMVLDFDAWVETHRSSFAPVLPDRIEWDIFLSKVNDFKTEIIGSDLASESMRFNVLTANLPKYLWRAIGTTRGIPLIEFIFDATDIEQGNIFVSAVPFNIDVFNLLVVLSSSAPLLANIKTSRSIFNWLSSQPTIT